MANEVDRLKAIEKSVSDHNDADTKFQGDVNAAIAALKAAIAANDTTAVDAELDNLETVIGAQPTLVLPN